MKIVAIFADSLYAIHYEGEADNEYDRLMELWTDVNYLREFAKQNQNNIQQNVKSFVGEVSEDAELIQDIMDAIEEGEDDWENFFKPYHNGEMGYRELSLQKGRPKGSYLRLFAIRIDSGTYLITGGAIKLVRATQESQELMNEWQKMKNARSYLKYEGVFDNDSFQELKTEQDEN